MQSVIHDSCVQKIIQHSASDPVEGRDEGFTCISGHPNSATIMPEEVVGYWECFADGCGTFAKEFGAHIKPWIHCFCKSLDFDTGLDPVGQASDTNNSTALSRHDARPVIN